MHKRIDFRDSRKTDNVCLFPRSFQDKFNLVLCFSHFTSNQWLLSTGPGFSVWMSEAWHRVFMVLARPLLHFPLCEDQRVSAQSEVKKVNTMPGLWAGAGVFFPHKSPASWRGPAPGANSVLGKDWRKKHNKTSDMICVDMADIVLLVFTIFSPAGSCLRIPGRLVPARPGSTRQPGPVAGNEPDSGHGPGLRQHWQEINWGMMCMMSQYATSHP